MTRYFILLFIVASLSLFGQNKHQVSIGYGLNNTRVKYGNSHQQVISTNFIFNGGYNYLFKNGISLRGCLGYAKYNQYIVSSSLEEFTAITKHIAVNIGSMYHFLVNNKLDLSSGFSLGRQWSWLDLNQGSRVLPLDYYVYSINLLNVMYYPFSEKIGLYGEVIIDDAYLSNYFLGLVYQF